MRIAAMLMAALVAGCAPLTGDRATTAEEDAAGAAEAPPGDALAPEIFRFAGEALWDGRPSLGGVWVAHSDVEEPSRVLIRRAETGTETEEEAVEVTGALFRREDAAAGPALQVSSDAAEALGLVAGQPAALEVTALRRVEAEPDADPEPDASVGAGLGTDFDAPLDEPAGDASEP